MSYFQLEQHFWRRMTEPRGVVSMLAAKGKAVVVSEGTTPAEGSVNLSGRVSVPSPSAVHCITFRLLHQTAVCVTNKTNQK